MLQATQFNLDDYLKRIQFTGQAQPDLTTLQQLMQCQLYTVPFENLDVQAGKIISLDPDDIIDKIVYRNRGGYCYEVNGLFALALQAIGFDYQLVAARPMFYPVLRPKTHMVLVVNLDGQQWLCDLGFGSYGLRQPMNLQQLDQAVAQHPDIFRLSRDADSEYLLEAKVAGEWQKQFAFNLSPYLWVDFVPANYLNSTHPDAIFTQKYLVVRHHATGRYILFGDQFKSVQDNDVHSETIETAQLSDYLQRYFGLNLAHVSTQNT